MINYEDEYEKIIENLQQKNSADISNVIKAYNFACDKHKNQFRKSGEPYILHPIQVAGILERLDFNTDVICAALLHDTVEDCGVSVKEIENMFNKQIAQIVDAVTAIESDTFNPDTENIFSNTDEFLKLALEDQTYQKLISIGKDNIFGFYIKFADRLNNLQTIGVFPKYKKEAKIAETKKWIIPLAKMLKTKYFYENLNNECFLISSEDENQKFLYSYNIFYKNMKSYIKKLKIDLTSAITKYLASIKSDITLYNVFIEPKLPYEIYKTISQKYETSKLSAIKEGNIINVPTYNIFIITNDSIKNGKNISFLYNMIADEFQDSLFSIIGYNFDEFDNKFLAAKDKYKNLYDITLLSRHEYTELFNGTIKGTDIDLIDETTAGGIETDYITILSPNNDKIKVPDKSTVLDFAFRLHKDIGFSCKYAFINNSPAKSPIYTRLNNGDKVSIVCELENGLNKNIAELRWLAYCKNENTKRILIKYFEKKYNSN